MGKPPSLSQDGGRVLAQASPEPAAGALGSGLGGFAGGEQSAGVWGEGLVYGCTVNRELLTLS